MWISVGAPAAEVVSTETHARGSFACSYQQALLIISFQMIGARAVASWSRLVARVAALQVLIVTYCRKKIAGAK